MTTVLLHGFWGQPSDWNAVLRRLPLGASVWVPDLYELGPQSPQHTIEQWVEHFHDELERRFSSEPVQVVGYSMGGRLALNAVVANPKRFSRVLLVSAAPFAHEPVGTRRQWEQDWKLRFQNESWDQLAKSWQDQPIFKNSLPEDRRQTPELRTMLGLSLVNWSLTRHTFDEAQVKLLPPTVEWLFGALDQKYMEIAKLLRNLPVQGQIKLIENAGHRIPTDAPEEVSTWVAKGDF